MKSYYYNLLYCSFTFSFQAVVPVQTPEPVYENEGFAFRDTQADGDTALYEQIQGVGIAPSIPMENIPRNPERFEREGKATATDNEASSKYQEFSYQSSVDPKEVDSGKRVDDIQDSYGHLVGFTRRPGHSTTISSEDQNPYQELQPENRSDRDYQSLQKMQRLPFNI